MSKSQYLIIAQYKQTSNKYTKDEMPIDSADDLGYAKYLVKQYQFIYVAFFVRLNNLNNKSA